MITNRTLNKKSSQMECSKISVTMWLHVLNATDKTILFILCLCLRQLWAIPNRGEWATVNDRDTRLFDWLIFGCETGPCAQDNFIPRHSEYEGYDGWYNNLGTPSLGAIDTPLLRLLPPKYDDGSYQPVKRSANPLRVSSTLMEGANGRTSKIGRTAFLVFFGQQVVEEILDAQRPACPPEYFNIKIDENHEYSKIGPEMPFLRTRFDQSTGTSPNNPRQQINEITPYLDGNLVYGAAKGWTDILRTNANGEVAKDGQLSWNEESIHLPETNYQRLPEANPPPPTYHDAHVDRGETENVNRFFNEIVFNEARKWVIATQQAIVVYDWLPKYMGSNGLKDYGGYDPSINPQISHAFQSAAFRFGHTLVTSGVYLRNAHKDNCLTSNYYSFAGPTSSGVRTCNSFFRAQELFTDGKSENFEKFIIGLASQSTEREDNIIVDDLRSRVFGPLEFNRRDLMAVNIQRGRDHGLPDYNTARRYFSLSEITSLTSDEFISKTNSQVPKEVLNKMADVYGSADEMDIWPGGLMETTDGPGQLFTKIIEDQFQRIRDGDRFWFENINNGLFSKEQIGRIRSLQIIDLIFSVTNLTVDDIQLDPFRAVHKANSRNGRPLASCGMKEYACNIKEHVNVTSCYYLPPLSDANLEPCTPPQTYDYFTGSVASYIITFCFVGLVTLALLVAVNGWSFLLEKRKREQRGDIKVKEGSFKFKERVSRFESRTAIISFNPNADKIVVDNIYGKNLRILDVGGVSTIEVFYLSNYTNILIKVANHYDLFMVFDDSYSGQEFYNKLSQNFPVKIKTQEIDTKSNLVSRVVTVKDREKDLTKFTNYVRRYVFDQDGDDNLDNDFALKRKKKSFLNLNLTKTELAESLGMELDSIFLKQLFGIMDADGNGFISLKEFLHVMLIFNKGSVEKRAKIFFKIYDTDGSGYLETEDFVQIFQSSYKEKVKPEDTEAIVNSMLLSIGLRPGQSMNFDQFFQVVKQNPTFQDTIVIDIEAETRKPGNRFTLYEDLQSVTPPPAFKDELSDIEIGLEDKRGDTASSLERWRQFCNKIKSNEKIIFWGTLYTLVMMLVFAERAYYYSVEREHGGLRHIAGYGVTVTRGAASAMMFTYSTILVTMCRNILSFLRSTPVHTYFPFDDMVPMHKYIGWWALTWTILHIIGHAINFYHISTQTASDLSCLFRDYYRSTHVLPKFHYWCWETITGLTGVLLTIQIALIYAFATFGRHHLFKLFWLSHNTYPLLYVLLVLHGIGNLVQPPFFYYFFLAPCILFVLDKLVSVARNTIEIDVARATHLPSNVTLLHIRRPHNFSFLSGQWLRLACPRISSHESHPFTISSAPHETYITLHIRAVGPFTKSIRKIFPDYNDIKAVPGFQYPKVQIDGPFGEVHQSWWNYEVVVFVGGGIGVTPFASILKDIVQKSLTAVSTFKCKRVIFLWVTRSQKQFEWMTNILHHVEESDIHGIIRIHIFITQFKSKFDMRSFLIYMGERHFQRVSGKSLFTGLRAITHFSRPDFAAVFRAIKKRYNTLNIIAVFTCGNASLSNSVEHGCQRENKTPGPVLKHCFENF